MVFILIKIKTFTILLFFHLEDNEPGVYGIFSLMQIVTKALCVFLKNVVFSETRSKILPIHATGNHHLLQNHIKRQSNIVSVTLPFLSKTADTFLVSIQLFLKKVL